MSKAIKGIAFFAAAAIVYLAFRQASAEPGSLVGNIVSVNVSGGKIVVQPKDANAAMVTVETDAKTVVTINGKKTPASLDNIKTGMEVVVLPPTGTATEIRAYWPTATTPTSEPAPLFGTIVSMDAASGKLVVQPKDPKAAQTTVETNDKTIFKVYGKKSAFGDFKVGMTIKVAGSGLEIRTFTLPPTTTTSGPTSQSTSKPASHK